MHKDRWKTLVLASLTAVSVTLAISWAREKDPLRIRVSPATAQVIDTGRGLSVVGEAAGNSGLVRSPEAHASAPDAVELSLEQNAVVAKVGEKGADILFEGRALVVGAPAREAMEVWLLGLERCRIRTMARLPDEYFRRKFNDPQRAEKMRSTNERDNFLVEALAANLDELAEAIGTDAVEIECRPSSVYMRGFATRVMTPTSGGNEFGLHIKHKSWITEVIFDPHLLGDDAASKLVQLQEAVESARRTLAK